MTDTEETRVVNEKTGGEKGQKINRFDLIPAVPMRQVARHYGLGARKYADRNWERGYDWSLSIGALERHVNLFKGGEDIDVDPDTGAESPHMAAVVFHALALLEFAETHPELDDRPSTVRAREAEPDFIGMLRTALQRAFAPSQDFFDVKPTYDELFTEAIDFVADAVVDNELDIYVNGALAEDALREQHPEHWAAYQRGVPNEVTLRRLVKAINRRTAKPPVQSGDRVSVRQILRAVDGAEIPFAEPVFNEDGVEISVSLNTESRKTIVNILDKLEDAGFQITKA